VTVRGALDFHKACSCCRTFQASNITDIGESEYRQISASRARPAEYSMAVKSTTPRRRPFAAEEEKAKAFLYCILPRRCNSDRIAGVDIATPVKTDEAKYFLISIEVLSVCSASHVTEHYFGHMLHEIHQRLISPTLLSYDSYRPKHCASTRGTLRPT
jgi:hypothetical protein